MQNTDTLLKAWIDTVRDHAIFLLDAAGRVATWTDGARRILRYEEAEVLVVNDDPDTARSLGVLLRLSGHDAHIAHDGPTAIERVAEQRPDAVLLDIGLPGMNGYEVAGAIRQISAVPLLAMTGFAPEPGAEAEFAAYLIKPVDPGEVLRLLAELRPRG